MYKTWIVQDLKGKLFQVTTETDSKDEAIDVFLKSDVVGLYPVVKNIELLQEMYPTAVKQLFAVTNG